MKPALIVAMATASGLAAANLYYNQPLLHLIATDLHVADRQAGILPALSQIGYATGLFFLVPLGDMLERRRLITTLFGLVVLFLIIAGAAPSLWILAAATFVVGVSTIMAQLLLPFAVSLSEPEERGQIIGTIMSGLLIGILLSRTLSGIVGEHFGWRAMYYLAAATMGIVAAALWRMLPDSRPDQPMRYPELMASLWSITREQPVLREVAISGGLAFATFSVFWSTLVFFLASPVYRLGPQAAGLFGIAGAGGALAAPLAGRLADRRSPRFLVGVSTALILIAYVIFLALGTNLWELILGVVLLDIGVQACHISNQTRVYGLLPEARNRLNTIYMVSYFVGGSFGSYVANASWSHFGWPGVCWAGIGFSVLALALHLATSRSKIRQ